MILQSLIRTYFLNLSLETFFQKFYGTFVAYSESDIEVSYRNVRVGDRFSRIEYEEQEYIGTFLPISIIYYNCLVTAIESLEEEGQYILFEYESSFEHYHGDNPEFLFHSGVQHVPIDCVRYFK